MKSMRTPKVVPSELHEEFLSLSADEGMVNHVSPSRGVMHTAGHISSRPSLINPESRRVLSPGTEAELGKYIEDVRVRENCVVKGVVFKYPHLKNLNPATYLFVEFEKKNKVYLDIIEIPTYRSKHSYFGYRLHPTEELMAARHNTVLKKGTILAKTDSYGKGGFYDSGVNLMTAYMSHEAVAEDGIGICRDAIHKFAFTQIDERVTYLGEKDIPVNTYGDATKHKFIPDIGEKVTKGTVLNVVRKRDPIFCIVDTNNDDIMEPDYNFDEVCNVEEHMATVMDIEVIKGTNNKSIYSENMVEQLDFYAEQYKLFAERIVSKFKLIRKEITERYTTPDVFRLTHRAHRLVTDLGIVIEANDNKRRISMRKKNIDQYRVKVTCMSIVTPSEAFKLTDKFAAKGVVCSILEPHEMPLLSNGVRAEAIVAGADSTGSRMNYGRIYEPYLSNACIDEYKRTTKRLLDKYGPNYKNAITQLDVDEIFTRLRSLYSLISLDAVRILDRMTERNQREEYILDWLDDDLLIPFRTTNEYELEDIISCIKDSEFRPFMGPATYTNALGKVVTSKEQNVLIGPCYFLLLDRTGRDFSGVASPKVNGFMLPVKGGEVDKYKYPHNLTPVTTNSETETRIEAFNAGPTLIAEIMDMASAPTTTKLTVRNTLEAGGEFDSNFSIDRKANPYGKGRPLAITEHVLRASGIKMAYQKDDDHN